MSLRLSQFLSPTSINLQLRSRQRPEALTEVAELLRHHPDITSFEGFCEELQSRDRMASTAIGHGVALPHSRTAHLRKIVAAVGRSERGLPDESGPRLRLLFVLGTPRSDPGNYLLLVSALCRLIKEPANRNALFEAPTPEAFYATIVALEDRILGPAK